MRLRNKKYASSMIKESDYVIENPKEQKGKWHQIFRNEREIHIEIGMGKGNFIIQMALAHPETNYIGIEMYDSVLVMAVKQLQEREEKIENLRLIRMDAREIEEVFEKEISRIYLNFSDPWPKAKHAKRRLTSEEFLTRYEHIFKDKKVIFQKTDNNALFEFSMETLEKHGYQLKNVTRDLYANPLPENIATEYETKFRKQGIKINRLEAYQEKE